MTAPAPEISVIVPVYMGRAMVMELAERLVASLATITSAFEIILVDDRAPDNVWPLIVDLGRDDPRIRGIRLSRNFGQHPALTSGIDHARGRWLVVMDCDLQDRPEDIPLLYRKAQDANLDIVIAARESHDAARRRKLSSRLFHWALSWLADIDTSHDVGNFRIFNRAVADAFRQYREQFRLLPALMARLGFSVGHVAVDRPARAEGVSSYTYRKLVRLAVEAIIANSEKPLWFGIYAGFTIAAFAFVLVIWAFIQRLLHDAVMDGWTSLFIAVGFFSGVQLIFAGILGVYLGRVFNEVKRRPIYLVAEYSQFGPEPRDAARASHGNT
jgi:polyisoprenyl-phosphate glycosyltransferase